jgi:hypothetical protein
MPMTRVLRQYAPLDLIGVESLYATGPSTRGGLSVLVTLPINVGWQNHKKELRKHHSRVAEPGYMTSLEDLKGSLMVSYPLILMKKI